MSKSSSAPASGISFSGLLTIVFITLKLTGYISWPWAWVLSPLWISFCIFICILAAVLAFWTWTGRL